MLKNIVMFVILSCSALFAATFVPTVLDSVKVPVPIIKQVSPTVFTGKITYMLTVGDNDSLNIALDFVPQNGGPVPVITYSDGVYGLIPMANGINGKNDIFFTATFSTPPDVGNTYLAKVTVLADQSNMEKTARLMLAAIPSNAEKIKMITGTGFFCTNDANGGSYGTVLGFHMIDGPHGVNIWRNGSTTAFPSEVATACAFDTGLSYRIAKVIANEARPTYLGRDVNLGPMLNLVRDPRGGRDFETWGEDPYLMGKLAISDIHGRQSERVVSCPKHFICNDQERDRVLSSSNVGDTVLRQTYCYPFEMAIRQGGAWAIMAAYNKLNGVYCTENSKLEKDILRSEWGFRGICMTDWGTLMSIKGAAAGTDIEMDESIIFGGIVVGSDNVTQDILDEKILRCLRVKQWTGCAATFGSLAATTCTADHALVAYEAAQKSMVLVKNNVLPTNSNKPLLPLDSNGAAKIAVVGPYANQVLTGPSRTGTSSYVTPCVNDRHSPLAEITARYGASKMVSDWTTADIVIVVVSTPTDGADAAAEGLDRDDATLPASQALVDPTTGAAIPTTDQNALISQIIAAGKKTIVVLEGGCAVVKDAWYNAPSVIVAFFGGQRMGMALADIIFGRVNPSGKLSVTFPVLQSDLPSFTNDQYYLTYEGPNEGRGYPYYIGKNITPLIPFGYGLSYTTFTYSNPVIPTSAWIGDKIRISADVTNSGTVAGDEIVQLYISQKNVTYRPVRQLRGFAKVSLAAGEKKTVNFDLKEWDFAHWSNAAGWIVDPGSQYDVFIAKNSTDANALKGTITLSSPY